MSNIVISGDTSGSSTLQAPAIAGGSVLTLPVATDTLVGKDTTDVLTNKTLTSPIIAGTPTGVGVLTSGTSVSASSTAVNFTTIPPWVKRITVLINGLSTSSTGVPTIRLGTSINVENTGYASLLLHTATGVSNTAGVTSGFEIISSGHATNTYNAIIQITNMTGNLWLFNSNTAMGLFTDFCNGSKTLAGLVTQLQLTTTGGTDTFDAGSINIMYE